MIRFKPHKYQKYVIDRVVQGRRVALFLGMGLGKTVCTLTAIKDLLAAGEARKVLVIAPKKVAETTWTGEVSKWEHLTGLRISQVLGTAQQRGAALDADADVYVINRENVVWLMERYSFQPPFDMLVLDESSSFKNHKAKRFRALRRSLNSFDRVVLLTGTPMGNGPLDLWAQMYLLDRGQRLGRSFRQYTSRWFRPDKTNGFIIYSYRPLPTAAKEIPEAIADISVSMSAEDWRELPPRIDNVIKVSLGQALEMYKRLQQDYVLLLPDSEDITAASAAALINKLLQLADGFVYTDGGGYADIHDAKLEALREIAETGKNLLVFYTYKRDRDRILEAFPGAVEAKAPETLEAWNRGEVKMLLAHPASAGYGLNLQAGGNTIVWFGLTWSLEQYQQANARLHRQGQTEAVIVHHLVAKGTMDERVMQMLLKKDAGQKALLEAVKAEISRAPNKI